MHKVEKQIEINAPVEAVFEVFSRFDHFARWMKDIKNVEWVAARRTRWTAEAPDGTRLEWEAEIDELEPGRQVSWHASSGNVAAEGEARFAATPQGTTLMHLALGYGPSSQAEEASVAALADNLEQRLEEDLIWFRLYAEREAPAVVAGSGDAAPALSADAPPPSGSAGEEPSVHFESFSGMLRAGQVIRPARPITAQFVEPAEPPAPTPPARPLRATPARPARQSTFIYAIVGLLVVFAIGLFALTRRRNDNADQPSATPTPAVTPSAGRQPNQSAIPANTANPTTRAALATPVPEASPLPTATLEPRAAAASEEQAESASVDADTREAINATIDGWLAATNEKDIDTQMSFYAPVLNRYYRQNNYARAAVRADKARRFAQTDSVQMSTSEPEITLEQEGRVRVRFRKQYEISNPDGTQRGEVLQELVLIRSGDSWRIVSERDLRVLR